MQRKDAGCVRSVPSASLTTPDRSTERSGCGKRRSETRQARQIDAQQLFVPVIGLPQPSDASIAPRGIAPAWHSSCPFDVIGSGPQHCDVPHPQPTFKSPAPPTAVRAGWRRRLRGPSTSLRCRGRFDRDRRVERSRKSVAQMYRNHAYFRRITLRALGRLLSRCTCTTPERPTTYRARFNQA